MLVKILPINGTHMHVHDRKKYYPGTLHTVDDALGAELVARRVAVVVEEPEKKPEEKPVGNTVPFRRGPGRPKRSRF